MTFQLKIATIDVTSKIIKDRIKEEIGNQVAELVIETTPKISSLVTLSVGQTVEMWKNFGGAIADPGDKKFKGTLTKIEREGAEIRLICKDQLFNAASRLVTRVFLDTDAEAGKISEIFKTLINTHAGLIADNTTVQDSGTTTTIERFVCRNRSILDACKELARSLDWQFYYRADTNKVYFEPKGNTINASTLTVGTNVIGIPKWNNDTTELANKLKVTGATQLVERTDKFSGDGTTATFTLNEVPESIKVWVGSANFTWTGNDFPHKDETNLKTGGIENLEGSPNYLVDKEKKQFTFQTGGIPSSNSNNIEVAYTYKQPIPIVLQDGTSQVAYGLKEREVTLKDVRSIDDAITRGTKILSTFKDPFLYSELKIKNTSSINVKAGQRIPIVDNINGINDTFIVYSRTIQHPEPYDILQVGQREFTIEDFVTTLDSRIERLEEEALSDAEAAIQLVPSFASANPRAKSLTIYKEKINDSFIFDEGTSDNSKIERGSILDDFESGVGSWSPTNATIVQSSAQKIVGSNSMQVTPTVTNVTIVTSQSFGNLSAFTGVASGTPTQGVLGIWVYVTTTTDITSITRRFGSDASNYVEKTGEVIAESGSLTFAETGWNYVIFKLASGTVTGTPNWNSVAYDRLAITTAAGLPVFYLDYSTIGDGSSIANNGIDERKSGLIQAYTRTYV